VLAKTATVELAPDQAELLAKAQATGTISLALRALGDSNPDKVVASNNRPKPQGHGDGSDVSVIRYGVDRGASGN
jgi:pilus assembly protein CpaB